MLVRVTTLDGGIYGCGPPSPPGCRAPAGATGSISSPSSPARRTTRLRLRQAAPKGLSADSAGVSAGHSVTGRRPAPAGAPGLGSFRPSCLGDHYKGHAKRESGDRFSGTFPLVEATFALLGMTVRSQRVANRIEAAAAGL